MCGCRVLQSIPSTKIAERMLFSYEVVLNSMYPVCVRGGRDVLHTKIHTSVLDRGVTRVQSATHRTCRLATCSACVSCVYSQRARHRQAPRFKMDQKHTTLSVLPVYGASLVCTACVADDCTLTSHNRSHTRIEYH